MNDNHHIEHLHKIRDSLATSLRKTTVWPEPAMVLDLVSRRGDLVRICKHVHQMCTMHVENLVSASQVKLVYLIDGYLVAAKEKNPYGIYLFSRTIVEMAAFLHEVADRLAAFNTDDESQVAHKGEGFFACILRARFGTSDPELSEVLITGGVSKNALKPISVMEALKNLRHNERYKHITDSYDFLCDAVHHNATSHIIASSGTFSGGGFLFHGGGGQLLRDGETSAFSIYQLRAEEKFAGALTKTGTIVSDAVSLVISLLESFPRSPVKQDTLVKMTGSALGMTVLKPTEQAMMRRGFKSSHRAGRNEKCPCGSGKKFKKCCGDDVAN